MPNTVIDPCTRLILDFIRGGVEDNPSGEAKGNYNAYFGHTNSTLDLSQKTLDQIYEFQNWMVTVDQQARDPKARSTAVGGYQFLNRTLKSLVERLQLPSSTLFTPALQEDLAVELLKDCHYPDWWRGDLSDENFLHNLSAVWASLPDPQKGGRSHWDGIAGNSASTTQAKALAMLARARALAPTEAPKPSPEPSPQPAPSPSAARIFPFEEAAALAMIAELQKLILTLPSMTVNEIGDANTLIRSLRYIVLAHAAIRPNNL